jgi:hypothetical protein
MEHIKIMTSCVCSAFEDEAIGSRVTDPDDFIFHVYEALKTHDPSQDSTEGQHILAMSLNADAMRTVSAGVGLRSDNPEDYVLRNHRGRVAAFLKRDLALHTIGLNVVVYTVEAYLKDPDIKNHQAEQERVVTHGATHVIVSVRAEAGPKSPLTPFRFVHNLAGGNLDFSEEKLSVSGLIKMAEEIIKYTDEWSIVAD